MSGWQREDDAHDTTDAPKRYTRDGHNEWHRGIVDESDEIAGAVSGYLSMSQDHGKLEVLVRAIGSETGCLEDSGHVSLFGPWTFLTEQEDHFPAVVPKKSDTGASEIFPLRPVGTVKWPIFRLLLGYTSISRGHKTPSPRSTTKAIIEAT